MGINYETHKSEFGKEKLFHIHLVALLEVPSREPREFGESFKLARMLKRLA